MVAPGAHPHHSFYSDLTKELAWRHFPQYSERAFWLALETAYTLERARGLMAINGFDDDTYFQRQRTYQISFADSDLDPAFLDNRHSALNVARAAHARSFAPTRRGVGGRRPGLKNG